MHAGAEDAHARADAWFHAHSHRWTQWSLDSLIEAKRRSAQRVSLVVPARNEASTVGDVVSRVRDRLMETTQLLDEIIVIDSDSVDRTFEVATDAGATVYRSAEIRPDLGTFPGKGEAMWKSLFVTTGDVIVFMDADLVEWDTHFVPGLLGPMLADRDTLLVKGFYKRPFTDGDGPVTLEGGRVTELVARPLIALQFPELGGVVQPLAGEWAIRREHFASLRVPTGYGVEFAALVDTLASDGLESIAQVDLGYRAHRHQDLYDLGAMATQIMAAAQNRSELPAVGLADVAMIQFPPGDPDQEVVATTRNVTVIERPPAGPLLGGAA
jgi:glucosyl-3-phosphoglycerate synthase